MGEGKWHSGTTQGSGQHRRIQIQWKSEGKGLGGAEMTPHHVLILPVSAIPGPILIPYSVSALGSVPLGVPGIPRVSGLGTSTAWDGLASGPGSSSSAPGACNAAVSLILQGQLCLAVAGTAGGVQVSTGRACNFFETHCYPLERCYNSNSITINGTRRPRSWKVGN